MKTMAVTEVMLPFSYAAKAASVSAAERPQSSALIISMAGSRIVFRYMLRYTGSLPPPVRWESCDRTYIWRSLTNFTPKTASNLAAWSHHLIRYFMKR